VILRWLVTLGILVPLTWIIVGMPTAAGAQAAQTFTVNSTGDAVDAIPGDGACATAALDGEGVRCTLRAAIMESNAVGGVQTITLPPGTFLLTIPGNNEDAGLTGDLDIYTSVTVAGAGSATTIVDGNQIDRIFHVHSGSPPGSLTLRDLTVRNGLPDWLGGGVLSFGPLNMMNVVIRNNTSPFGGGGVYSVSSPFVVMNSSIMGNTANGLGGGIYNQSDTLTMTGSTISGNTVNGSGSGGGGVFNEAGTLILTNSTFSGNTANGNGSSSGLGGGIYQKQVNNGASRLTNVTITANVAPRGSGVYKLQGDIEFRNTLIAGNSGSPNCFRATLVTSLGHNLDGDNGCGFVGSGDLVNTDPKLGTLADYGGPTFTHSLLSGSPAIDTGSGGSCPSTDQRGGPRPLDGNSDGSAVCDIGSYEASAGTTPPPPTPPNVAVAVTKAGPNRLLITITARSGQTIQRLDWTLPPNASAETLSGTPLPTGMVLTPGSTSATFHLRRLNGESVTLPISVTGSFAGTWRTFVGGGPNAW
jgi:CSLREA domain-containing protein